LSPLPIKRADAIAACSTTSIISKPKLFSTAIAPEGLYL
jgi:hypothetical protein